jgi:hypothetical protein
VGAEGDAMIQYPPQLQYVIASRTGIAPVHLLDVQDTNGNCYYWASRQVVAPSVIVASGGASSNTYLPWILGVPQWTFHRSQVTDMGKVVLQNLSGDTLQSDFYKIVRKSALEGAVFVFRRWHDAAQYASREIHGKISVDDSNPNTVPLICTDLINPSQDVAPQYQLCEICQWRWSSVQCGSTQPNPCQNSFPTCQVIERIFVIIDNYEKNYGETTCNVPGTTMNRLRQI